MNFDPITDKIARHFSARLLEHGPTAKGVDWNSEDAQIIRFTQLARVLPSRETFSVIDYGCGYGALLRFLEGFTKDFTYQGFDISSDMIEQARRDHGGARHRFITSEADLDTADFTLASGIFNLKLDTSLDEWTDYVLHTLSSLDRLCRRGFAFNMLTSYSDADRMRPDLYYGDPCRFFDHCKTKFSKNVALLHDYEIFDFTILVRK